MKFLLWKIQLDECRYAKFQWLLFKLFGKRPKAPCGHTKNAVGYYCHLPMNVKYCDIINDRERHEVVCKCCGEIHMLSSSYIDPNDEDSWLSF